jgi:hypothetical protein
MRKRRKTGETIRARSNRTIRLGVIAGKPSSSSQWGRRKRNQSLPEKPPRTPRTNLKREKYGHRPISRTIAAAPAVRPRAGRNEQNQHGKPTKNAEKRTAIKDGPPAGYKADIDPALKNSAKGAQNQQNNSKIRRQA